MSTEQAAPTQDPADLGYQSTIESAGRRGNDDRRGTVEPSSNPAPRSPAPDERVVREGEETLDRIKPY